MPRYPSEQVDLENAQGAILRQHVAAERDQPPFDRVTMDGIAIKYSALDSGNRTFSIRGIQAAGAAAMEIA